MDQKFIGFILIILAIILGSFVYMVTEDKDAFIEEYVEEEGTCFTEDGSCLHDQKNSSLYIGGGITLILLVLGIYLAFFDKRRKLLMKQHKEVSTALKASKEQDAFKAFLAGFNENEKKVLSAIKEQEGIKQSTLRYKTGMSKTSLSLLLKELEEKGFISRKEDGKTKKVYLQKVF